MLENIIVTGITDLECYPPCKYKKYWKQCIDTELLCIPDPKPDIESINEIKINICINDFELIDTILGLKLILHGIKNIKILYTADNCQQSLHSAHWNIPFCDFILLGESYSYKDSVDIKNIFIGIENSYVKHFEARIIDISVLYIICPEIKTKNYNSSTKNCTDTCSTTYQVCNGKIYNTSYDY